MEENCSISIISSLQKSSKGKKNQKSASHIKICDSLSLNISKFDKYIKKLDQTLGEVNRNQLDQLKKKYRFYLSKVQKLQQTRNDLQQKFDSITDIVQNSTQVKQEKESIDFITLITEDANSKFQALMKKVEKQRQQKKIHNKQILHLKQLLKRQKDKFFESKRIEANLKHQAEVEQQATKLQNADCTFKSIVIQKRQKQKQKIKNKSRIKIESKQNINECSSKQNEYQYQRGKTQYIEFKHPQYFLPQITKKEMQSVTKNDFSRNKCQQAKASNKMSKTTALFCNYQTSLQNDNKTKIKISNKTFELKNKSIISELNCINKLKGAFLNNQNKKIKQNLQFDKNKKYGNYQKFQQLGQMINLKKVKNQKYSLNQQEVINAKQKVISISERNQQILQIKEDKLRKEREEQLSKQRFLQLSPEQIIKLVINNEKLQELLTLIKNDQKLPSNKKGGLKLIR